MCQKTCVHGIYWKAITTDFVFCGCRAYYTELFQVKYLLYCFELIRGLEGLKSLYIIWRHSFINFTQKWEKVRTIIPWLSILKKYFLEADFILEGYKIYCIIN